MKTLHRSRWLLLLLGAVLAGCSPTVRCSWAVERFLRGEAVGAAHQP